MRLILSLVALAVCTLAADAHHGGGGVPASSFRAPRVFRQQNYYGGVPASTFFAPAPVQYDTGCGGGGGVPASTQFFQQAPAYYTQRAPRILRAPVGYGPGAGRGINVNFGQQVGY